MTAPLRQRLRALISDRQRQLLHDDLYTARLCRECRQPIHHRPLAAVYCSDQCRKRLWDGKTGRGGRWATR